MRQATGAAFSAELENKLTQILRKAERLRDAGEEETRARIIDAVLEALGWPDERRRMAYRTQGGGIADLVLLSTENRPIVFVEAKELGARLDDAHVRQALGYAQAEATKWAVLTNGYEWRVYDAQRHAPDPERLFRQTDLRRLQDAPEEVCRVLQLLSPESVEGGGLEAQAEAGRAYEALLSFLNDEQKVARALRARKEGFRRGLRSALQFARERLPKQMDGPSPAGQPPAPPSTERQPKPKKPEKGWLVHLPSGTVPVTRAKQILVTVAEYLVREGKLRPDVCPVAVTRGERYLVSVTPCHGHGLDFFSPVQLSNGLHLETHVSADDAVKYSYRLFEKMGLSPDLLKIERLDG